MRSKIPLTLAAVAASVLPVRPAPAQGAICDFSPTAPVVLDTDSTTVVTSCGPRTVTGGVFVLRNITIPAGITVQAVGSRPLVMIAHGSITIDGTLSANGGDGESVNTLGSPNIPSRAGSGVCGGGNGGRGSPSATQSDSRGEAGFGPGQVANLGGGGGRLACPPCVRGAAGAGGAFATVGDPYFKVKAVGTSFVQQLGQGGFGCLGASGAPTRTLSGGIPGPSVLGDSRADNDFFGVALNVSTRSLIWGELTAPVGGAGGGGGGDSSLACGIPGLWINDSKGGGGGGGGGAIVLLSAGKITIGAAGLVSANGGHGGGGEQAGSNNLGAGGGGGSGGMLVLYSLQEVELHAHGETYANGDYAFALSADGGIGQQGPFGGVAIAAKYPPPPAGSFWDSNPAGGFGGLGVIELITPPGSNADQTNTILDDNVHVVQGGVRLVGAQKTRYLAWRGFPNASGAWVDDFGVPTNIGDNEGDLRPAPILMPVLP